MFEFLSEFDFESYILYSFRLSETVSQDKLDNFMEEHRGFKAYLNKEDDCVLYIEAPSNAATSADVKKMVEGLVGENDMSESIQKAIDIVEADSENGYIVETLSWASDVLGISKSHKMRLDNDIRKLRKDLANMINYCNEEYPNQNVIHTLESVLTEVNKITK